MSFLIISTNLSGQLRNNSLFLKFKEGAIICTSKFVRINVVFHKLPSPYINCFLFLIKVCPYGALLSKSSLLNFITSSIFSISRGPIFTSVSQNTLNTLEIELINNILEDKKSELQNEIDELKLQTGKEIYGFPFSCVDLLICPHCGIKLTLYECNVTSKGIVNGRCKCEACIYKCIIENGIVNCRKDRLFIKNKSELNKLNFLSQALCESFDYVGKQIRNSKDFWDKGNVFLFNGADIEIISMCLLDKTEDDKIYVFAENTNFNNIDSMYMDDNSITKIYNNIDIIIQSKEFIGQFNELGKLLPLEDYKEELLDLTMVTGIF